MGEGIDRFGAVTAAMKRRRRVAAVCLRAYDGDKPLVQYCSLLLL